MLGRPQLQVDGVLPHHCGLSWRAVGRMLSKLGGNYLKGCPAAEAAALPQCLRH